jgi:Protein of unknown function (DUF3515)
VGCSSASLGAVSVTAPSPSGDVARQCAAVVAEAASQRVAGQEPRDITPTSSFVAAWGDPAILLTCSGTAPDALTPTSQCFRVNAVDWLVTQNGRAVDPTAPLTGTLEFTTVGRSAYVEVVVPDAYQPAADALVDVARAVKNATTVTKPCV